MLFADTFKILLIALSLIIAYPAFWLVARALWPNKVRQASEKTANQSLKCFLWGVIPTTITMTFGIALLQAGGPVAFLGGLVLGIGFLFSQVGVAGLATLIGERLGKEGEDISAFRVTGRGGIALVMTFLFPIIGWVLLPLITIVIGFGAMLRTIFSKKRAPEPLAEEHTVAEPEPSV